MQILYNLIKANYLKVYANFLLADEVNVEFN